MEDEGQIKVPHALYDYVKRKIDFSEFLETEIGCSLRWYESGVSAGTVCPMPNHSEKKSSFRIKLTEEGCWIWHCFGCNLSGTIIDFCKDYYDLEDKDAAVRWLCKKFNIKDDSSIDEQSLEEMKKKAAIRRKIECANIVSSNQCRMLLRKDFKKYSVWVSDSYKKINKAMGELDLEAVENVGFEASEKIHE